MKLAGRSGISYFVVFASACVAFAQLVSPGPAGEPALILGVFIACLAFDCIGGVVVRDGEVRFRAWVRVRSVPIASIEKVTVHRAVGESGISPVVVLRLREGGKVNVLPLGSISKRQTTRACLELGAATGCPAERWPAI